MRADLLGSGRRSPVSLALLFAGACLLALTAFTAKAAALVPTEGARIIEYSAGVNDTQAGGHPDFHVRFKVGTKIDPLVIGSAHGNSIKEGIVETPAGFSGNPHAYPACSISEFSLDECPIDSQIGYVIVGVEITENCQGNPDTCDGLRIETPLYNLMPPPEVPGLLGFKAPIFDYPIYTAFEARTGGDFGLTATVRGISQEFTLRSFDQYLWGVPANPIHDAHRYEVGGFLPRGNPQPSNNPENAFLSNPTTCSGPLSSTFFSVGFDNVVHQATAPWPEVTGCDLLGFNPSLSASPSTKDADSPSGIDTALKVPQPESPNTPSDSQIKGLSVRFPEGFSINPNAADGKVACPDAEAMFGTSLEAHCPEFSKVGTVTLVSTELPEPINGAIYLGAPLPGNRYRLFLTADGFGTHIKLSGSTRTDPQTGRMTVVFEELPQSPLTEFDMHFFGSERGLLATPTRCGKYAVETTFTPWDNVLPDQQSVQFFEITSGPGGSPCPGAQRPFSPGFRAVGQSNAAGAHSSLSVRVTRPDGDQNLDGVTVKAPPGFSASLKGIPYCSDQALARAASPEYTGLLEQAAPSCPAASQVGVATTGTGAGNHPLYSKGNVYLAGPYKGKPLSLAIVTPAVSGPYDLGDVVVRVGIGVDPETAQVTAVSDPLPRILDGIPLRMRSVQVDLNRENFVLNPTSCEPFAVQGTILGAEGAVANPSEHFQVGNCAALPYRPKMTLTLSGGLGRLAHPAIHAVLDAGPGEANTHRVSVALPAGELLDNAHFGNVCTRVQFAADSCPEGSVLGTARATTPLLDKPLEGKVYLRSSPDGGLPNLVADLRGQIDIVLVGKIDTVHHGALRTTFSSVPDAPVEEFKLDLLGGTRGLLQNSHPLCGHRLRATVRMTGQNATRHNSRPVLRTDCGHGRRKKSKKHHHHGGGA